MTVWEMATTTTATIAMMMTTIKIKHRIIQPVTRKTVPKKKKTMTTTPDPTRRKQPIFNTKLHLTIMKRTIPMQT